MTAKAKRGQSIRDALQALRKSGRDPEGSYTIRELGDILGLGSAAVRERVRQALAEGIMERITKMVESPLDGKVHAAPAFRLRGK